MRVQGALDDSQLAAALAQPLEPLGRLHPGTEAPPEALSGQEPAEEEPSSDRPSGP